MLTSKLTIERIDRDYRLIEKREQYSRSFLRNFINLLYVLATQSSLSINDISNTARSIDCSVYPTALLLGKNNILKIGAAAGGVGMTCVVSNGANVPLMSTELVGDTVGIVVGTGTNAVTPTDVALQTRVVHGTSANTLEYGGCELLSIAFANPNGSFNIRRYLTNNSGGAITINELGIYAVGCVGNYQSYTFCITRDLVSPGVAVANTELLRATYTVQITV